jgi:hypothetical protein
MPKFARTDVAVGPSNQALPQDVRLQHALKSIEPALAVLVVVAEKD